MSSSVTYFSQNTLFLCDICNYRSHLFIASAGHLGTQEPLINHFQQHSCPTNFRLQREWKTSERTGLLFCFPGIPFYLIQESQSKQNSSVFLSGQIFFPPNSYMGSISSCGSWQHVESLLLLSTGGRPCALFLSSPSTDQQMLSDRVQTQKLLISQHYYCPQPDTINYLYFYYHLSSSYKKLSVNMSFLTSLGVLF